MFLNTQNKNSFGKKMFSLLFFLFIFIANFNSVKISHAAPATDPTYEDTVKYPRIELAVNASLAADKEKLFITSLKNHKCLDSSYNIDTAVVTNTSLNAINSFRMVNGITQEKNVGIYTWEALMLKAGEKTKSGDLVFDCGDKTSNGGSLGGAVQTYQNISSFSGEASTTTFTNTNTGGLGDAFNYILTLMAVAIIVLVAFRIIEGAITKGAFENIYDQQKGKKLMETAGKALLIFIFAYAVLSFINPDLTGWTFIQSVTGLGSTGSSTGNERNGSCTLDTAYNTKNIKDQIKSDEGFSECPAYDVDAYSVGYGYHLNSSNNRSELAAAGVSSVTIDSLLSYKGAKGCPSGAPKITESQASSLLDARVEAAKKSAANWGGSYFTSAPENVQKVLINMSYNMGSMSDFKKTGDTYQGFIKSDWSQMARGIQTAKYCTDVPGRCARLVGLLLGSCPSTIQTNGQTSISSNSSPRSNWVYTIDSPVKYYSQCDPRWANDLYAPQGRKTMCGAACGPTSLAMVISQYTGQDVLPTKIAKIAVDKGYKTANSGTSWSALTEIPKIYNLKSKQTNWTTAKNSVIQGNLVIVVFGPGHFTSGGHFEVITKIDNGNVFLNNPHPNNNVRDSKGVPESWVANEGKAFWVISKS